MLDAFSEHFEQAGREEHFHMERFQPKLGLGDGDEGEGGTIRFTKSDVEAELARRRVDGLGGDGHVAWQEGAPGAVELGPGPLNLLVRQVVVEGTAAAEGIDSEAVMDRAEELDGVASNGIASRLRLAVAERGNVRKLFGDGPRAVEDDGGKNESCVAGIRRIVSVPESFAVSSSSDLTGDVASEGLWDVDSM